MQDNEILHTVTLYYSIFRLHGVTIRDEAQFDTSFVCYGVFLYYSHGYVLNSKNNHSLFL